MHPILLRFGPFIVTSYSVMLTISYLAGVLLAGSRARTQRIDPGHIRRLALWAIIAALLGSRLWYVLLNLGEFSGDPLKSVALYRNGVFQLSGLAMTGGVLSAIVAVGLLTTLQRAPTLRIMDVMAPSLGLGIFFTRLGCFLSGCCYGLPTEMPWGVVFPPNSPAGHYQRAHFHGVRPVHPAQIYSSVAGLLMVLGIFWLEKKYKRFDGFATLLLFMFYSVERFVVDFFRYYDPGEMLLGLTHNQHFSLILFAVAAVGMLRKSKRAKGFAANAGLARG